MTGDYATTIIPPGVTGYKKFDLYDSLNNPEGNPDKVDAIMTEQARQGHPCKTTIKVAFPDTGLRRRLMATVVEAYQQAGIQVTPVPIPPGPYYATGIGDPANPYDMMLAGWIPDWASGSAILPANFDGRRIPPVDPATGTGRTTVTSRCSTIPRSTSRWMPRCPRPTGTGRARYGAISTSRSRRRR